MKRYSFDAAEHVHTLDGKPLIGTSSVMNVVSKPLSFWAAELAAVECLAAGERIATIREEYEAACRSANKKAAIDALQKKYPIFRKARFAHFEAKDKAADKGTDLHAQLEAYVKRCLVENNGVPM